MKRLSSPFAGMEIGSSRHGGITPNSERCGSGYPGKDRSSIKTSSMKRTALRMGVVVVAAAVAAGWWSQGYASADSSAAPTDQQKIDQLNQEINQLKQQKAQLEAQLKAAKPTPAPTPAPPLTTPSVTGPLTMNSPTTVDVSVVAGPMLSGLPESIQNLEKFDLNGVASGIGIVQDHAEPGDRSS